MLRRVPAVLLVGGVAMGCLSPTLPLPPPTGTTYQMVDATQVVLSSACGGVPGGAAVSVENETETAPGTDILGPNVKASACGSWSSGPTYARTGDEFIITYVLPGSTETSLPESVVIGAQ